MKANWLFAEGATTDNLSKRTMNATEAVVTKLTELAQEAEKASGMQVLDFAPGLYTGPTNAKAIEALTYEACATWLWGQMWGDPDHEALLDVMAN